MYNANDNDWKTFYDDGKRFMEIAVNASKKATKFTPEILYNMICMSIEKLFMAYFIKSKKMPSNHTLLDLVDSIKELEEIPVQIENKLLYMNDFQEICSIEQYNRKIPAPEDIETFVETLNLTHDYLKSLLA